MQNKVKKKHTKYTVGGRVLKEKITGKHGCRADMPIYSSLVSQISREIHYEMAAMWLDSFDAQMLH